MKTNLEKEKNYTPQQESIIEEIIDSLSKVQKSLPCKFFYDERGSDLFEQIVDLDEYYLARTEISIMNDNIGEISELIGESCILIEPGSGSANKIKILLENLKTPSAYIPIDISETYVKDSTHNLSKYYPALKIVPIIADYTSDFKLPEFNFNYNKLVVYYPGSTIGNFSPDEARDFLKKIAHMTGKNNYLLIGVDLKKEKDTLERAYNDAKGITEKFNINILSNLNNLIESDFITDRWSHKAFFNEDESRVEMHLVSKENQTVKLNGYAVDFHKGETIHTENSYKYGIDEFCNLVSKEYKLNKFWTDKKKNFAVLLFQSI
ncbi:MAG: L-histidine N(alpha)-methyltransferase [Thermodesulfobacteriota bacterium]